MSTFTIQGQGETARDAFRRELINWCTGYTQNGYPVFPCGPNKKPLVKWSREATTDPNLIEVWWSRWPNAMIGIPTGARSGLFVVDIDVKSDVNGFDTMKANGWTLPADAVEVVTPSGGRHFYFKFAGERNSASKIGPGIDTRGEGGFIIAPPSRPDPDEPTRDYRFSEGQELTFGGPLA
jgi:hypothetical protein